MIRKLSTWLLVALAGGAFVAGCGSSNNSTSSSQATSTPATTTPAPAGATSTPPTPSGPRTPAGEASHPTPAQAVASCKQSIQAQPTISASAKSKLAGLCAKAASGDRTALHKVAQEVCVELVNASQIPAGASRERALAVCKMR
jgi:hypothetical protein